ncbi:MAG TPA: hypothetical protein VHX16_03235 [Chloroflexota bacterium]|nr:hypothetical protein [Chloroflexota bacterium]
MARLFIALVSAALALAPAPAKAHEKWFVDQSSHPVDWSLVLSSRTLIAIGVALVFVAIFTLLQRAIGNPDWPRLPIFHRMAPGAMTLLSVQTAIALISTAVQPALLAANLHLPSTTLGYTLAALEVLVAFSFITGLGDRIGASALALLWLACAVLFGLPDALEQLLYIGIAVAIFVIGRTAPLAELPRPPFSSPEWGPRALMILRVISGVSFLCLAIMDKIWTPGLGLAFLQEYPHFNVLRLAGLEWATDDLFVFLAGIVETTIGALLISGRLTRVVILGMWLPFNLTVPFLPPVEMLGHLPIFGIMYLLLVYGSGSASEHARLPTEEERSQVGSGGL